MSKAKTMRINTVHIVLCCAFLICAGKTTFGQIFGIELHNNVMPASGGMAGTSLTRPQDFLSAINGNPATLTQYRGTQFTFAGVWIEPTININQGNPLPLVGVTPYAGKSQAPGSALGNIGVVQDLGFMGIDGTMGIGFLANAGLGLDHRQMPGSNGTQLTYLAWDIANAVGVQLTERLSAGGTFFLGTSYLDGPFSHSSSVQLDYGVRGSLGLNYELGSGNSLGAYWQSKKRFTFESFTQAIPGGAFTPLTLEHPENFGLGLANRNLMNGRLLLAVDLLWKHHSDAATLQSIYQNQFAVQTGAQLVMGPRLKLRAGYAWNQNPMLDQVPGTIAGIVPIGGIPAVQYLQAQFATIFQHRITGGFQLKEVMPNCDLDMMAGGAFKASQTFGSTTSSIESYWVGFGLTWRVGSNQNDQYQSDMIVPGSQMNSGYGPQSDVYLQQ